MFSKEGLATGTGTGAARGGGGGGGSSGPRDVPLRKSDRRRLRDRFEAAFLPGKEGEEDAIRPLLDSIFTDPAAGVSARRPAFVWGDLYCLTIMLRKCLNFFKCFNGLKKLTCLTF